jgi:hypothetical protein
MDARALLVGELGVSRASGQTGRDNPAPRSFAIQHATSELKNKVLVNSSHRRLIDRGDVLLFWAATAVLALHATLDAFEVPQPGTTARDHLVQGRVSLAVIALAGALYSHLRTGNDGLAS